MSTLVRFAAAIFLLACEAGQGSPDVAKTGSDAEAESESDAAQTESDAEATDAGAAEETVTPTPVAIVGCDWASGAWVMVDCLQASIPFNIHLVAGCQFQITSQSPALTGAYGQIKDGAMSLILPATAGTCNANWNGEVLVGACSLPNGPCGFEASPEP